MSGSGRPAPEVVTARGFRALLREFDPDAVLLACTGPVVRALSPWVSRDRRRVLVSGLPGISVPANEKAWEFRAAADLFVVHSAREVAEFGALAGSMGLPGQAVRATLPFLRGARATGRRDRVVFATQAKVPERREERERILLALAELAVRRPDLSVVVKLRALAGEEQTHREFLHYRTLWQAMGVDHSLLTFDAGPMHAQLEHAAGFVTVSSTAALEAIAAEVPLLVLADFGVSAEMINLVFEGSGVLGTLAELGRGEFQTPSARWSADNYFHPEHQNDWVPRLEELVARASSLPDAPEAPGSLWERSRAGLRVELPPGAYKGMRRVHRHFTALVRNTT